MGRSAEVRGRLLEAAGEEFAARGFDAASVRAICERAGANVAAVNYHFGGKGPLYREAVAEAYRRSLDRSERAGVGTLAEELRAYIAGLLAAPTDGWAYRLMARDALLGPADRDDPAQHLIRPRLERLRGILRRACPAADDRRLDALALGVVGQCLCYRLARPVAARLIGPERLARLDGDYVAGHVAACCLAALGLAPALGVDGEPR
jgi:AcrR family transcriptional regulator